MHVRKRRNNHARTSQSQPELTSSSLHVTSVKKKSDVEVNGVPQDHLGLWVDHQICVHIVSHRPVMGILRVYYPALVGVKAGTNVLVAGGTGVIGSGTTISLLKQGARVLVATRSMEKLDVLHDALPDDVKPNLSVVEADVCTYDGVKRVFKKATTGKFSVDHVVASMGNCWQKGSLVEQSLPEFNKWHTSVAGHFLLMRTFLPYLNLRVGTTYTVVTGHAGEQYMAPHTAFPSVASAALNGLATAVRAEFSDACVAVNQFHVRCSVQPMPDHDLRPDPHILGHDLCGGAIAACIASLVRGKTVINTKMDAKKMILSQD